MRTCVCMIPGGHEKFRSNQTRTSERTARSSEETSHEESGNCVTSTEVQGLTTISHYVSQTAQVLNVLYVTHTRVI